MHNKSTCPFCAAGYPTTIKNNWTVEFLSPEPVEEVSESMIPETPEYMFDEFLKLTTAVVNHVDKKTIHAEANIFDTDVMLMYPEATQIYIKDMPEPKSRWYKVEKKDELE